MTLREEISKVMADYTYRLHKNKTIDATIPEKILRLFEIYLGELPPASASQRYLGCNNIEQKMAYQSGWEDGLETAFKGILE
jgi:hypothetical protein